jgi:hypothetical protein
MDLAAVTFEITRNLWISKGRAGIASNCDRDYVSAIIARSDDEPGNRLQSRRRRHKACISPAPALWSASAFHQIHRMKGAVHGPRNR